MFEGDATELAADTLLWQDHSGHLAGYALVDRFHNLLFQFRQGMPPTVRIERELLGWAERRLLARTQAEVGAAGAASNADEQAEQAEQAQSAAPLTLDAAAQSEDVARVALLLRNGFVATGEATLHMARSLAPSAALPVAPLPPAFTLRPLAGEGEVAAYVAAHQAAYGTQRMTAEQRLAMLHQPAYRSEIDLVAVAGDGALAAFCVCAYDRQEIARTGQNEGEISIVGVRPEYRGQGLARALIAEGLRRLQALGAQRALLGVSGDNAQAIHVYESLGFQTQYTTRWYAKPIERQWAP